MMEWFSNLTDFEKFYWIITGVSSLFFMFILITTFIGGDVDDVGDIDAEVDADTGVGFQFFTLKNTVAFFAIFGWSGISCINAGYTKQLRSLFPLCGIYNDDNGCFTHVLHAKAKRQWNPQDEECPWCSWRSLHNHWSRAIQNR